MPQSSAKQFFPVRIKTSLLLRFIPLVELPTHVNVFGENFLVLFLLVVNFLVYREHRETNV